jgi:hypothetical protein
LLEFCGFHQFVSFAWNGNNVQWNVRIYSRIEDAGLESESIFCGPVPCEQIPSDNVLSHVDVQMEFRIFDEGGSIVFCLVGFLGSGFGGFCEAYDFGFFNGFRHKNPLFGGRSDILRSAVSIVRYKCINVNSLCKKQRAKKREIILNKGFWFPRPRFESLPGKCH